jgi:hypothetical protein
MRVRVPFLEMKTLRSFFDPIKWIISHSAKIKISAGRHKASTRLAVASIKRIQ